MKTKSNIKKKLGFIAVLFIVFTSCSSEEDHLVEPASLIRSQLIFTEVLGESVTAHADHFHGLASGKEGKVVVLNFDDKGKTSAKSPLVLNSKITYKVDLKTWNAEGNENQTSYIANKETADRYKAFLIGGNLVLNVNTLNESGALFQPRELNYIDGTTVNGKYETTGILTYLIFGESNKRQNQQVSFILRELDNGVKGTVERIDWNRDDYGTAFAGRNILDLKFNISIQ